MKKPRFNSVDWQFINAYGHGYALGRSGFAYATNRLWGMGEKAQPYEMAGWEDGATDYACFGELDGLMEDELGEEYI
jgi:hypothetical protein